MYIRFNVVPTVVYQGDRYACYMESLGLTAYGSTSAKSIDRMQEMIKFWVKTWKLDQLRTYIRDKYIIVQEDSDTCPKGTRFSISF